MEVCGTNATLWNDLAAMALFYPSYNDVHADRVYTGKYVFVVNV